MRSAKAGEITLRGTVGSLREKREAKKAAQRVIGVLEVDNQLKVRLMGELGRIDADIRGDVPQALMLDSLVPSTVDAKGLHFSTDEGAVTVKGTVRSWAERDEAIAAAWSAPGVTTVRDDLTVTY